LLFALVTLASTFYHPISTISADDPRLAARRSCAWLQPSRHRLADRFDGGLQGDLRPFGISLANRFEYKFDTPSCQRPVVL